LHKQCTNCGINFEIISIDDASTQHKSENNAIQFLTNCSFIELSENIGRSKIRNLLASKSKYDWLLLLDSDNFPATPDFISKYINNMFSSEKKIFFGGVKYLEEKPESEKLLRWKFGHKREAIALSERIKNPYKTAFVFNLFIKKSVFESVLFDEEITKYGYEDFVFIHTLKNKNIEIQHIENPAYHLNSETSTLFLSKTKTAMEMLLYISKTNKLANFETKITKTYKALSYLKLQLLISKLFQITQLKLENNLTSEEPSLLAFDCYKIGYFCYLNSK
jgi:glycosyltransferase involved in cell wall biosynthesis